MSEKKYRCPNCGAQSFLVTAHVTQEWKVDEVGDFVECTEECSQVTHNPNDEDIWTCANCGYEDTGTAFIEPEPAPEPKSPPSKPQSQTMFLVFDQNYGDLADQSTTKHLYVTAHEAAQCFVDCITKEIARRNLFLSDDGKIPTVDEVEATLKNGQCFYIEMCVRRGHDEEFTWFVEPLSLEDSPSPTQPTIISIPLNENLDIVADVGSVSDYPEIAVGLKDKDGNWTQDLCMIRPHEVMEMHFAENGRPYLSPKVKNNKVVLDTDKVDVILWEDSTDEDYTKKLVVLAGGSAEEEEVL